MSLLGLYTDELLRGLSKLTQTLALTPSRNTSDPTGTTAALAQPDCSVWHNGALLFKGEDKVPATGTLADAREELGQKMSSRWSVLTMGSLPFIVCYASCGAELQFYIIMRDTNVAVPVSEVFDLYQVRWLCLCHQYWR